MLFSQFSHAVMCDSFGLHGLQHARSPCPSPTPGACSNSCPSSRWCHPANLSSVVSFSSCLQSFPASVFFQGSIGQSTGASATASVLPMTIQDWFPLGWTGGSPCSSRDSQESLPTPQFKGIDSLALSFLRHSAFFTVQLSYPYVTAGKTIALTIWTFVGKVMSLFFNMLSRLVIVFLPRSKCLLISWLQSPSAVIWEPKKIKSDRKSTRLNSSHNA